MLGTISVHHRWIKCGTYIEYDWVLRGRRCWHRLQYGWILKTFYSLKYAKHVSFCLWRGMLSGDGQLWDLQNNVSDFNVTELIVQVKMADVVNFMLCILYQDFFLKRMEWGDHIWFGTKVLSDLGTCLESLQVTLKREVGWQQASSSEGGGISEERTSGLERALVSTGGLPPLQVLSDWDSREREKQKQFSKISSFHLKMQA